MTDTHTTLRPSRSAAASASAPSEADLRDWFSFDLDPETGEPYPFVEDESACIHGYGHQDKAAFVAAVARYDVHEGGLDPQDALWPAELVAHKWAVMDPGGEWFRTGVNGQPHTSETPGAFPITTLWNCR